MCKYRNSHWLFQIIRDQKVHKSTHWVKFLSKKRKLPAHAWNGSGSFYVRKTLKSPK